MSTNQGRRSFTVAHVLHRNTISYPLQLTLGMSDLPSESPAQAALHRPPPVLSILTMPSKSTSPYPLAHPIFHMSSPSGSDCVPHHSHPCLHQLIDTVLQAMRRANNRSKADATPAVCFHEDLQSPDTFRSPSQEPGTTGRTTSDIHVCRPVGLHRVVPQEHCLLLAHTTGNRHAPNKQSQ